MEEALLHTSNPHRLLYSSEIESLLSGQIIGSSVEMVGRGILVRNTCTVGPQNLEFDLEPDTQL